MRIRLWWNKQHASIFQGIKDTIETSYAGIFPETFKMVSIFLALPIGPALEKRSFSHLKTWLRSRLSDCCVAQRT